MYDLNKNNLTSSLKRCQLDHTTGFTSFLAWKVVFIVGAPSPDELLALPSGSVEEPSLKVATTEWGAETIIQGQGTRGRVES